MAVMQAPPQVVYVQAPRSRRDVLTTYVLWFFLGVFGVHRFYLGLAGSGCLYAMTGGFCFLGVLLDLFLIPSRVDKANGDA